MKKSKKLLSILLAVVMVFSVVAVPVSAAVPSNVTTLEQLVQSSNLAGLVDWLLASLNGRKEKYADTVLNFVCGFVEDIAAEVPEGTDVFNDNVATSTKATYVMNFLDKMLAEQNLNEELGEDILNIINAIPGLTVDLNSVNGILNTLKSVDGIKGIAGGDIANLNLNAMIDKSGLVDSAQSRSKTGDLQIIYNLIQFLADNTNVFKKFLSGKLDLGIVGSVAGDLQTQVNSFAGEITTMLKDLVYESVLGAPDGAASHAESAYKDWTVDQMLVGAIVKLINGAVPADTKEIDAFLAQPVYDLLTTYADELYDKFLLGWLQNDLVGILKDFAQDNELSQYFNFDFEFSASEFNFAAAENGILGEFNDVLVALLKKLLAEDVVAELKLENGGNDKLNANLEKVVKFVLPKLADVIDPAEFDFTMYTAEYVADKSLSELAPGLLKLFFPGWFHLDAAGIDVVEQIDTMGEAAALAVYYALIEFNEVMFTTEGAYDYISDWNKKIFEEDGVTLKDLGNSDWNTICLDMAADAAMFGLALNGEKFFFDFSMDDIKTAKANGWDGIAFLDEIADWGIDMVKGIPAVTDHIGGKRGVANDNYGPFYKLNVLLNEILNWSFLNDVSYGSFNLDIETLIFDGLLGNLYDFDLAGILGLFAVNNKQGNVLNMNTVPALLSIVDNVLNILFSHSGSSVSVKEEATCAKEGFSVTACSKCGLYQSGYKATAKKEHVKVAEILTASTCEEKGLVRYTCENCDFVERKETNATGHTWGTGFVEIDGAWFIGTVCAVCEETNGSLQPAPTPEMIEIASAPTKVKYELNSDEELDLAGLVVKTVWEGGIKEDLDVADITVATELDTTKAGDQIITISYLGCTATFTVTVVDNSVPIYVLNNTTGNGIVNSEDARAALRSAVGLEPLSGNNALAADFNKDGSITSVDARAILRFAVGLPTD